MKIEDIGGGVSVFISGAHTFGTDAFLLSYFAAPKKNDVTCDLCSGCGIIPLLWLRGGGGPKTAYALDIQADAVEQMRRSSELSALGERFIPVLGDLRESDVPLPKGSMDVVSCNPPYNASGTGIISGEDVRRTARHETLCTLDEVCAAAKRLLRFHGRFCLCQLPERLVDVLEAMRRNGLEPKRLRFVQQREDSPPWLVLVEGKRGAKPFLRVEPPLIMRRDDKASPEMDRIYNMYGKV